MSSYNPLNPDGDPFGPPAIPTFVGCLHCQQEYDSYRIEWRVEQTKTGPHGFWCCPTPGCDGRGFGFDILPVDPNYQDEHGGWVHDDEEDNVDDVDNEPATPDSRDRSDDDDPLPW
jgi:hypothetical protein